MGIKKGDIIHYSSFDPGFLMVKGLSSLHEQINWLLEVPDSVYKDLQGRWWQFKGT
jgi:hypothetical protein